MVYKNINYIYIFVPYICQLYFILYTYSIISLQKIEEKLDRNLYVYLNV